MCVCVCVCVRARTRAQLLSHVQLFMTPWTVAFQAHLPMGFFSREYWNRLPFPPSGNLLNPGIEPTFPVSAALPLSHQMPICSRYF